MILELDCGNTLLKWRVVSAAGADCLVRGAHPDVLSLIEALRRIPMLSLMAGRMVSVRTDEQSQEISLALQGAFSINVHQAQPALELAGVRNGYRDYQALGMDRWLASVAAFNRAAQAVLVIDLGTAITADYVDALGQHRGGFIVPGWTMMRDVLRQQTQRIRYTAEQGWPGLDIPGQTTADAVERGCASMIRDFVQRQLHLADALFGDYQCYITGGDAQALSASLGEVSFAPDLVFSGLALACPLPENRP